MKPILKEGQDVLFPRQTNYHHGGIMSLNSAFGRSCPNFPAKVVGISSYDEQKGCYHIHVKWNLPPGSKDIGTFQMLESETLEYQKYKASDFKVNDIVSIKFPESKFSYGGEDVYNREFARINIPLDQRRGVVASVNEKSDYILIDFPAIRKYGWKFLRTELQKVDTLTKDNLETSAPRSLLDRINTAAIGSYAPCTLTDIKINGINSTTIGSDNTAIGTESHSFEAFPSGYVKTLNEDMPLFQRVEVKPNKIPDYI